MHGFQTAALLITIAAAAGFVNYRLLRLPQTSGTLVVALVTSLMMLAVDAVQPAWGLRTTAMDLLGHVDFNQMLMGGMLSFLLFAGALHLNLDEIVAHRWSIASLATVGVAVSTCLVGLLTWWASVGWYYGLAAHLAGVRCADFTDRSDCGHGPAERAEGAAQPRGADWRRVSLQ